MKLPSAKFWQVALFVVLIGYIGVKDVVAPLIKEVTGASHDEVVISQDKILQLLETAAINRTNISALTSNVSALKADVERIERKLDTHILSK